MPNARNGAAMKADYEDRGLTREQFARRVGLSPKSISNIANGGPCSRAAAARIADELGWENREHLFRPQHETAGRAAAEATEATPTTETTQGSAKDMRAAS